MAYEKKITKRPHYKFDSHQEEQYPKFIVLQSEKLPLTKLSPFIIEKNVSSIISVKNLKRKLKKFHNININTYPHEKLNTSRGVVKNKELSLCSIIEIKNEMEVEKYIPNPRRCHNCQK